MSTEKQALAAEVGSLTAIETSPTDDMVFPNISPKQKALKDITEGFMQWRIWLMLAYQDIKLRYRRSVLGPFWLTISMGITVYSMGFLYSRLFHIELDRYYPFLVAGMLAWSLISTIITEMTDSLIGSDGFIKQIKMPYSLYIHRISARNVLIFMHNMLVMIPVLILFHKYAKVNWHSLFLIPGLMIVYFNCICYGLVLGMIGARYRDISQMIKSLVTVIFFITPVMWSPEGIGERHYYLIDFNPFYAFIELIRAPLLGNLPTLKNILLVGLVSLFGFWSSISIFTRYRTRIVYWL